MRLSGPCFKQKYVDNAQKENRKGCTKSKGHKSELASSPLMSISGGGWGGGGGREKLCSPLRQIPCSPTASSWFLRALTQDTQDAQ